MKPFTHGIVAIGPMGNVLHFAGYHEEPNVAEWEVLDAELSSDTLADQEYQLYPADAEILREYNERQTTH